MSVKLNIERLTGVYAIVHRGTNRMYIGSSVSIKHRIWKHVADLRNDKHCNVYLQAAFNKHGESEFFCQILQVCSEAELLVAEAAWIERKQSFIHERGFNLIRNPARVTHSDETRRKMSNSSSRKGKPAYNRGIPVSTETRQRISEAGKGRIKSDETCEKLRQAMLSDSHPNRGKRLSDDVLIAMRTAKHLETPRNGEFKGVNYDRRTGKFMARIYSCGKHTFLGRYQDANDAARAYNNAAIEMFGGVCFLNNVEQGTPVRRTALGRKVKDD